MDKKYKDSSDILIKNKIKIEMVEQLKFQIVRRPLNYRLIENVRYKREKDMNYEYDIMSFNNKSNNFITFQIGLFDGSFLRS